LHIFKLFTTKANLKLVRWSGRFLDIPASDLLSDIEDSSLLEA
jgi:hypothetical protein